MPVAVAVEDIEMGLEREAVLGMPAGMDPNIAANGVIPQIVPPDVDAMKAY